MTKRCRPILVDARAVLPGTTYLETADDARSALAAWEEGRLPSHDPVVRVAVAILLATDPAELDATPARRAPCAVRRVRGRGRAAVVATALPPPWCVT